MSHGETGIMSNDRDARRTESLVELFDRFFFCRSFHSKLFPFGGFAKARTPKARTSKAKTPGYTRRPAPPDPETTVSRPSDVTTFSSLPSRLPRPDGHLAPGSRFEPNPLLSAHGAKSEIQFSPIYAGHTIKPLNKHLFAAGACSLGQDGIINTIPRNSTQERSEDPRSHQPTDRRPALPNHAKWPWGRYKVLLSCWVLESERESANRSPRIRSAVFNQSLPRCQALNHAIFRPASNKHASSRTTAPTGTDFTCAIKKRQNGPGNSEPASIVSPTRSQPSTVPGSTLTPGPIVEDTAMRWT